MSSYGPLIHFLALHGFQLIIVGAGLIASMQKKQQKKQREWKAKAPPQSARLPGGMPSMSTQEKSSFARQAKSSTQSNSNLTDAGRTSRTQSTNSPWSKDADPFSTKRKNR